MNHEPTTPEELAAADAEFLAGMPGRIAQATQARAAVREQRHLERQARAERHLAEHQAREAAQSLGTQPGTTAT